MEQILHEIYKGKKMVLQLIEPKYKIISKKEHKINSTSECYSLRGKTLANKEYPCMRCAATGIIRDPDYEPDPVEGYKMAGHIKCPVCHNTGIVNEDQFTV